MFPVAACRGKYTHPPTDTLIASKELVVRGLGGAVITTRTGTIIENRTANQGSS